MTPPVLVACGHGTRSGAGRAAVSALIGALARAMGERVDAGDHDGPVEVVEAYVDVHGPELPDVVAAHAARGVVVVPLLLSAGYHVKVDMTTAVAPYPRAVVAEAMGPDHRLAEVLTDRLREVGATPQDQLLLGAAGSSDPDAVASVELQADQLRATWPRVRVGYGASARPRLGCESARLRLEQPDERLVGASYLLAPGFFASRVQRSGVSVASPPLLEPDREVDERLVALLAERYDAARAT